MRGHRTEVLDSRPDLDCLSADGWHDFNTIANPDLPKFRSDDAALFVILHARCSLHILSGMFRAVPPTSRPESTLNLRYATVCESHVLSETRTAMSLTEFNILKSMSVPNVGAITPRGLTVVAGPNSSGKTQMLSDVLARCTGEHRELVVCSEVEVESPSSFEPLLEALHESGAIQTRKDDKGREFYEQVSPFLGEGSGGWRLETSEFKRHAKRLGTANSQSFTAVFQPIGRMLVTSLFLKRRLVTTATVGSFDYETQQPQNELQALYVNANAQQRLTAELRKVFGRAVWLDASRGGKLCLRVNDSPEVPPDFERLQPECMKRYRTIDSEGDGLKSYTAICISLLLGQRPICLIDEPEMCLHPPQAYALGRFIGQHGTSEKHTTMVATHSSHILRGIIEETSKLQVLRLSRTAGKFVGNLIPYSTLKDCVERPSTKVETILDGIFSQAVAIVESEGDRAVYEAATEKLGEKLKHDVHFVSVGGIGGFASTSLLYKSLFIPTVVISDLDLLSKQETFRQALSSLAPKSAVTSVCNKAQALLVQVRMAGPSMSAKQLQNALNAIMSERMDWGQNDNEKIRRMVSAIPAQIADVSLLKRGGRMNYVENKAILEDLDALLADCRRYGLFLVPVGELDFWCEELMKDGPSKRKKAEWANEAAIRIRNGTSNSGDVWSFVESMVMYQQDEARRYAGYPISN
jgi:ABC-type cobalamin/Fe3+-siderophores transport system ATPase subunit